MRHAVLALALLLAAATPVLAAEKDESKAPQTVALQSVALPIVVDGRLINYVFVSIKLDLSPSADGALVRAKEEFFRDDLVRAGHRTPFTRADDYTRVDEARVKAEVMRFSAVLMGPKAVRGVEIIKQVSQKMRGLPSAAQARAPDIVP